MHLPVSKNSLGNLIAKTSVQSTSKTIETGFDFKGSGIFVAGFSHS